MHLIVLTIASCIIANVRDIHAVSTEDTKQKLNVKDVIQTGEHKKSSGMQPSQPVDCEDLLKSGHNKSGVYFVWPGSRLSSGPISVYCDMETDGGGWTVIQRRGDFLREQDYFHRDWNEYKKGFGNLKEDFWLGNDNIYALSNQRKYSIRFDLESVDGKKAFAVYSSFYIDDEYHGYILHVTGYSGNAGDSFGPHNERKFTTKDRDNDTHWWINCAQRWTGGWWFNACHPSHLNGQYYEGKPPAEWEGIMWEKWKGPWESLAFTEMKIRQTPYWIKGSDTFVKEKL